MLRIRLWLSIACVLLSAPNSTQTRHWKETANETIWRGRYKNCDHGYLVDLPPGVVGHNSLPPNPNHGILISAANPSITTEVTLEESRLVSVYDSNDALELGSPQAYLKDELKSGDSVEKVTVLEYRSGKFRGFPALYAHLRKKTKLRVSEVEELIVYRTPKDIGALFNVVLLCTTPECYRHDHALFLQIRDRLQFVPVPKNTCSND